MSDDKLTVCCALCARKFFFAVPDPTTFQGRGCASFVITRAGLPLLLACYGSEYDEGLFRVYATLIVDPDDPICDLCIAAMLDTGGLVRIPGKFQVVPKDYQPPLPARAAMN